jgi:hypothetical protein
MKTIEEKDTLLDSIVKQKEKWKRLYEEEKDKNEAMTLKFQVLSDEIKVILFITLVSKLRT